MRYLVLCFLAAVAAGRLADAQDKAPPTTANVSHCVLAPAEQADISPLEIGVIQEIAEEGQRVAEKQLLLQLDDRKAQKEVEVAQNKLDAARTKYKAADINVKYAVAAKAVADAEYRVNDEANKKVPGSVPKVRMNELLLKCTETALAIEKAQSDQEVAAEEAKVAVAEVGAAQVMVDRHKVLSPIAGEVVEVRAHKGEAVQPSQPVVHVVRLDSVWVQGDVNARDFARAELGGRDVTVNVEIKGGEKRSFPGKVIFVRPLTDSGRAGGTYLVRAKVENVKLPNGYWQLSPGMFADMSIQLAKP